MTIGNRINNLRKQNSFSQEYIAEMLGVSRQAVSKWEQDQSAPDTYNLIALAELFGVSVEYLATGKKPENTQATVEPVSKNSLNTQKIVGLILLTTGLLALILGFLFSAIILILSFFMLLCGILCLTIKRNIGLIIAWSVLISIFLILSILTGSRFIISAANGVLASAGTTALNVFSILFTVAFILTAVVTIVKKIKNRNK